MAQREIGRKAPPQRHPRARQPDQQQGLQQRRVGERCEQIEPGSSRGRIGRKRGRDRRFESERLGERRRGGLGHRRQSLRRRLSSARGHPRGQDDRGQDQPRERDQPQGIGDLRPEPARHPAARQQHQGDQDAGPYQRMQKHVGHHGRSSFSSASISARSASVRASLSARWATSDTALPPNRRSTSRRDSPPM